MMMRISFLAILSVFNACSSDTNQLEWSTVDAAAAIELPGEVKSVSANLWWIHGCGTYWEATLTLELSAVDSIVNSVEMNEASFDGWWSIGSGIVLNNESLDKLPIQSRESVNLNFHVEGDGGLGECSEVQDSLLPMVPLEIELSINGVDQTVLGNSVISCGWDQQPLEGC